jgi:hypothetical protein
VEEFYEPPLDYEIDQATWYEDAPVAREIYLEEPPARFAGRVFDFEADQRLAA